MTKVDLSEFRVGVVRNIKGCVVGRWIDSLSDADGEKFRAALLEDSISTGEVFRVALLEGPEEYGVDRHRSEEHTSELQSH